VNKNQIDKSFDDVITTC